VPIRADRVEGKVAAFDSEGGGQQVVGDQVILGGTGLRGEDPGGGSGGQVGVVEDLVGEGGPGECGSREAALDGWEVEAEDVAVGGGVGVQQVIGSGDAEAAGLGDDDGGVGVEGADLARGGGQETEVLAASAAEVDDVGMPADLPGADAAAEVGDGLTDVALPEIGRFRQGVGSLIGRDLPGGVHGPLGTGAQHEDDVEVLGEGGVDEGVVGVPGEVIGFRLDAVPIEEEADAGDAAAREARELCCLGLRRQERRVEIGAEEGNGPGAVDGQQAQSQCPQDGEEEATKPSRVARLRTC